MSNIALTVTRLAAVLALVGLSWSAWGRGLEEDLLETEAELAAITARTQQISVQVAPGRGFITDEQARKRFQDCVYFFMVGEHEAAAEGFFALVTTAALRDAGLHLDAEWYLAESLYQMGNIVTAEARYQVIAEDASHPFRDEAVRRLLELYATSGQSDAFYAYYEQEIVRGRVKPSDLITYSVAKSFYHQGDHVKAKSNLLDVGPDSPYYRKARYFLGAIMVVEGDVDQARTYFREIVDLSVDTYENRQLLDLTLLALGRIHLERGEHDQAADYYSQIGGDSQFLADKLYELVWTFIKQRQELVRTLDERRDELDEGEVELWEQRNDELIKEALRGVEIFLLAFPEHEYTAQLQLLEGHLHMQAEAYDGALASYEQVIVDYTPIRERFAELASSDEEPETYFQRILELEGGSLGSGSGLPAYALAMMMADTELSRSLEVYRSLEHQNTNIEGSEALIAELETVLDASVGIGGFEQLRYDAILQQTLALQGMLELLEYEEAWLLSVTSGSAKRELEELIPRRRSLVRDAELAMSVSESAQAEFRHYQDQVRQVQRARDDLARLVASLKEEAEGYRRKLVVATDMSSEVKAEIESKLARVEGELVESEAQLPELEVQLGKLLANPVNTGQAEALQRVLSEVDALHVEYQRHYPSVAQAQSMSQRFRRDQAQVGATQRRLIELIDRLDNIEGAELERIRARFKHEVREVSSQRVELERTLKEAEEVSVDITRAGFGRLEDFFAESVLRADMGIVDVYWAQKLDVGEQKLAMQGEKKVLLDDLERRFEFIRQKLNQ